MTIQHRLIPNSELHEPKDVATALAKSVYVATGTGTGVWTKAVNGFCYFENIAVPSTLTYPVAYAKVAPTTIAGAIGNDVTEATTARLTYTGTKTIVVKASASVSVSQASGANRNLRFALYKNGAKVNGSVKVVSTVTALIYSVELSAPVSLATNDYIEMYAQNDGATGDISIYSMNLSISPQDH
jgi:hypothetical protein